MKNTKLILASALPRRKDLLRQIGITPYAIIPANIDETPHKGELPRDYALRMAREKAETVFEKEITNFSPLDPPASGGKHERSECRGEFTILAADTVVACGRRILPKAENEDQARACLKLLSGRRHHVYGGIALKDLDGTIKTRLCDTVVQFKRLTPQEIDHYIQSGEWEGKAGGYAIQGLAAAYIKALRGSYSNVVGLSLYDVRALLEQ